MKILILVISMMLINTAYLLSDKKEDKTKDDSGLPVLFVKTQAVFCSYSVFQDANEHALKNLPFAAKITDDFPLIPSLAAEIKLSGSGQSMLSLTGFWHSTGSRVHYKDYSGEFYSNLIINAYGFGLAKTKFQSLNNSSFVSGLRLEAGYFVRVYKSKIYSRIANESLTENDSYKDSGIYVEPCLIFAYKHTNYIFGVNLGLFLDVNTLELGDEIALLLYNHFKVGLVFGLNSNLFK